MVAFFVLVVLASPEASLTLTALGVMLYCREPRRAPRPRLRRRLDGPIPRQRDRPFDSGSAASASVVPFLLVAAAVIVGESTRRRTEIVAALGATQEAMAVSEREQTAMEERARIARELHDIVAHHLSVIAVQSETARLTSPRLPADARRRFEAIGDTARDALTETRRLLGVLREDAPARPTARRSPASTSSPSWIDTARDAGAKIRLIVQGKAVPLPAGTELAAYRIVQEALTNARRHAPGADVDVELSYSDDLLLIRVRDNGPGPGGRRARRGPRPGRDARTRPIAGGTFSSGAAEGGGFVVEVTLPTGAPT